MKSFLCVILGLVLCSCNEPAGPRIYVDRDSDMGRAITDLDRTEQQYIRREREKRVAARAAPLPPATELGDAARRGYDSKIRDLIRRGVDVNEKGSGGFSPLLLALANGHLGSFTLLIEKGASPNAPAVELDPSWGRVSVMQLAAMHKNPEYLRLALKQGGNPNFPVGNDKRTPIFPAIMYDRTENIHLLMEAGVDLNHQTASGTTPLLEAAAILRFDLVDEMLRRGADSTIKDRWGRDLPKIMAGFNRRGMKPGMRGYGKYLKVMEALKRGDCFSLKTELRVEG